MKKLFLFLVFIPTLMFSQADLKPTNWVNDYADKLTPEQETSLNTLIGDFEKETSVEFTIVIVESLDGYDASTFTNELFTLWGLGKEGKDNGLMILIAPNERKWWTEVGYGLEEYLTDGYTKRVSEQYFPPNFRNDDYYTGLSEVVNDYQMKLGKKTWAEREAELEALTIQREQEGKQRAEAISSFFVGVGWFLLFGSIVSVIIFLIIKRNKKRRERIEKVKDLNDSSMRLISALKDNIERVRKLDPNYYLIDSWEKQLNRLDYSDETTILEAEAQLDNIRLAYKNTEHEITKIIAIHKDYNQISNFKNSFPNMIKQLEQREVEFRRKNSGEYVLSYDPTIITKSITDTKKYVDNIPLDINDIANMRNIYHAAVTEFDKATGYLTRSEKGLDDLYSAKRNINNMLSIIPSDIKKLEERCNSSSYVIFDYCENTKCYTGV